VKFYVIILRSKRASKKGSVQHSVTEIAEIKEGRRRKDKKDEKNNEDKARYCKSGSCHFNIAFLMKTLLSDKSWVLGLNFILSSTLHLR
jgi:hypothetical protein